jgi:hypothetical protein
MRPGPRSCSRLRRPAAFLRCPRTEHVSKPIEVHVLVDTLNRLVEASDAPSLAVR